MTNLAHIPHIIGIAGRAGHGKDTVGAILADYGYQRVAFADKVREAALAINPTVAPVRFADFMPFIHLSDVVAAYGWEHAKQFPSVRQLLQRIGTEMGRNVLGENLWIDALYSSLDRQQKYVITDVRFENEVEFITANGGAVWFVDRPVYGSASDHASERLSPAVCDRIIVNDGTVDDLRDKVERIMKGAKI